MIGQNRRTAWYLQLQKTWYWKC